MPTARELLEQADALMRRNRSGAAGDGAGRPPPPGARSPSTSAPAGLPVSPRPIQREPIAPSVARTSLPVDPTESPHIVARDEGYSPAGEPLPAMRDEAFYVPAREPATPAEPSPPPVDGAYEASSLETSAPSPAPTMRDPDPVGQTAPERGHSLIAEYSGAASARQAPPIVPEPAEEEFPLLTETVDESVANPAAEGPLDDLLDDVPVLTDAVEEIDVGIVEEARGEPSLWELTRRGENSILGPAPDSIVVVPPPESGPPEVPQTPPGQGRDPLGLDRPPAGYRRADENEPAVAEEIDGAVEAAPALDGGDATRHDVDAALPTSPEREWSASALPSSGPSGPVETVAREEDRAAEAPLLLASMPDEPPVVDESRAFASTPSAPDALSQADDVQGSMADAPVEVPSADSPTATLESVSDFDQQRIREIAEEIGMQVLQRIDIFTDTTLRAQLGERLRPVVDRAAADLVAAINEHVGELLRVYISEAIEREIESWRNKGR